MPDLRLLCPPPTDDLTFPAPVFDFRLDPDEAFKFEPDLRAPFSGPFFGAVDIAKAFTCCCLSAPTTPGEGG